MSTSSSRLKAGSSTGPASARAAGEPVDQILVPPSSGVRGCAVHVRFRGVQGEPLTTIEFDGAPDANLHSILRDTLSELDVQIQHIRMFLERGRMKHTLWIQNADESAIVGARRNEVQAAVLERVSAHVGQLASQPRAEAV